MSSSRSTILAIPITMPLAICIHGYSFPMGHQGGLSFDLKPGTMNPTRYILVMLVLFVQVGGWLWVVCYVIQTEHHPAGQHMILIHNQQYATRLHHMQSSRRHSPVTRRVIYDQRVGYTTAAEHAAVADRCA